MLMCRGKGGKGGKRGKKQKQKQKKHTNFGISFVFVFQGRKTNYIGDEHEFYVLCSKAWIRNFLTIKPFRL